MTEIIIDHINPIASNRFTREIPRKEKLRQSNYLDRFDLNSLFYDIAIYKNKLMFIAPPIYKQTSIFSLAKIYINGILLTQEPVFVHEWKVARISYYLSDDMINMINCYDSVDITFDCGHINQTISVKVHSHELLKNSNVIIAINQDNSLERIRDWLKWNVNINGFDSAIIFDNDSKTYSVNDFNSNLFNIEGLNHLLIINYPVKFGPLNFVKDGERSGFDSDYAQYVDLAIARFKYCGKSSTFSSCDIDEYMYSKTDTRLVDAVKQIKGGYIPVSGFLVDNIFDQPISSLIGLRAKDFKYVNRNTAKKVGMKKYIVDLSKIPENMQLWLHGIDMFRKGYEEYEIPNNELGVAVGGRPNVNYSETFTGAHFKGLGANWRNNGRDKIYLYKNSTDEKIPEQLEKFINDVYE
ncbi:hypothetical protein [Weissella paramesenteroides]|uniref:hypothetical protein n=1 Tax=Weissella paramesenteroides TaxID=1249 RepID=UPI00389064A9